MLDTDLRLGRLEPGSEPLDLRAHTEQIHGEIPPGWQPIAALAARVTARIDELTEYMTDCIQREIPAYTGSAAVPRADLRASVYRNNEMMLAGIAVHREPAPSELEVRRALGHRRALQGVPVEALIQAYHVGYRELWQALVQEAENEPDAKTSSLLLTAATTVWEWVHKVTNAVAEAYRETTRDREILEAGVRQRFVEMIVAGHTDLEECQELARSLGFDPDGPFRALYTEPSGFVGGEASALQNELGAAGGAHLCIVRASRLLVLSQGEALEDLVTLTHRVVPGAPVGVGSLREGLTGAQLSIGDAERTITLARARGTVRRFDDDWLLATLTKAQERLGP
ncbi:MAG TPA: hypothetical protein VM600_02820, partial [Actinomycetota bacterium]|nr:hypothetical protein [Actinomycetota bacterium]